MSATGLPVGTTVAAASFTFQRMANGGGVWTDLLTVNQSTTPANGTAPFDTGWQNIAAPAKGDQYRFKLTGNYTVGGVITNLPATASFPITPIP